MPSSDATHATPQPMPCSCAIALIEDVNKMEIINVILKNNFVLSVYYFPSALISELYNKKTEIYINKYWYISIMIGD